MLACVRIYVYIIAPIAGDLSYRLGINVCMGLCILVPSWRAVICGLAGSGLVCVCV